MNRISELKDILGEALGWHKSRLDCFTKMLAALFAVRTVNLQEIALAMLGPATASSHYRRLQRFIDTFGTQCIGWGEMVSLVNAAKNTFLYSHQRKHFTQYFLRKR